jgi:hypothetical protein
MTKQIDRTANLHRARERFVDDRRQLAADLAKHFKKGDEKKRELFAAIQFTIDAIDQSSKTNGRMLDNPPSRRS